MNTKLFGVLVLLIIFALALAACSGAAGSETPPAGAPAQTATPAASTATPPTKTPAATAVAPTHTPAPTPTPVSTTTPDVVFLQIPAVNCCRGRTLEAGRYQAPPWLGIPLSVEVGEGWRALNEEAALLFLIGRGENVQNNPSQMIVFLNVAGKTTPERVIGAFRNAPELTAITEPVTVTVAGLPGLQLDSVAKANPTYEGSAEEDIPPGVQFLPVMMRYFTPGFLWTTSSPEARIRTLALTAGEQTLLLYLEAPPEEFDQFATDAESLLQSLELGE